MEGVSIHKDVFSISNGEQFCALELANQFGKIDAERRPDLFDIDQDETVKTLARSYSREHGNQLTYLKSILASPVSGILIKKFMAEQVEPGVAKLAFLTFMLGLGKPVHHQKKISSLVWDIKSRPGEGYKTFSEHNSEAPLHTDTQYVPSPERYIALFVHRKARCGGGMTRLLNGGRLFEEMMRSPRGQKLYEFFTQVKVPFLIPTIFTKNSSTRYIYAPIFSNRVFIRYRKDTLLKGIQNHPKRYTTELLNAVNELDDMIENSPNVAETMLEDGDLFISNNHNSLHARTEFKDQERWLFRIRFN